jgi:hypothetical protein
VHPVLLVSLDFECLIEVLEAIKLKDLNMIDRIGYGDLCLREENLSFINNYII